MMSSSKLSFPAAALKWPALASVAVLGLSGCSVANTEAAGTSSSTVRVVLGQEPPTLEACESNLTSTGVVMRSNVTEPLIERNPQSGELEPKLATEWKATSDTEWTLKLREGVTFQDGTPFNADAAAFTIERAVNSKLGCNVEGYVFGDADLVVKAVDATTLTVTTPEPDPILPLRLSFLEVVPDFDQRHRKGPGADRNGPLQDREVGRRPEDHARQLGRLLGRQARLRQGGVPVAFRKFGARGHDHQRRSGRGHGAEPGRQHRRPGP